MAQVKWKHANRKHLRRIIEREVAWFNGWAVREESMQESCQKAADKILRYLGRKSCKTK